MAIRLPKYEPHQLATRVGNVDPGFVQPLINRAGQDAASSTMQNLLDSGKQLTDVAIKDYVSSETARVSEALQSYRNQLADEQARFTKENQGQNALGAGEHFDTFAQEAAAPLAEKFSGKFRNMFMQDAAAYGLRFKEHGQAYAQQQEHLWKKSQWEGDVAQTMDTIAQDPGNTAFVQTSLQNLKGRYADIFPGMDPRAMDADLNHKVAGITIDSFLAKDQVGQARNALNQYRDILGAAAPQFESRINSKGRELEARARADAEMRFVGAFANDPLKGIAEISTPEGMAKYGMDAKTAISVRSMLQTQWSFNKTVEKQKNDTYVTSTVNGIYSTLMGDPDKGIAPDPAKAYQDLQNSNLDAITKIEMGKKLEEGTIGKTRDPAAVNDMARQIVNGSIDSDAPIDVMLAQGKASVGDVAMLKGMRKDMDSPLKDYLKRADHLINNAFARSQFAAGTPEAAIKEDRARSQLSTVITETYKKGGPEAVEKLFNSDTPMSIMNSNAITVDDALSSVNRVIGAGSAGNNKNPIESAKDFVNRRARGQNNDSD